MQKGLVSILLCTYNGEKYIEEQLESILSQTYTDFELIIVDDCSSDKTFEICNQFAVKSSKIKLFQNEKNLGLNKNFEKAIRLAKGDYLAFSDQDDIWSPNKIEKILSVLHKSDAILAYCNSEMIYENGDTTNTFSTDHNVFVKGNSSRQLLLFNTVSGHQMLFRKELVSHVLPLPESFWYDWWIAYIATSKFSIDFTEEALVKYRIHSSSFVQVAKKDKKNRAQKIATRITNLKALKSSGIDTNNVLIQKLIKGYSNILKHKFSFGLFITIMKNRKDLLFPRNRPTFGFLKRIRNNIKIALAIKHLE